MNWLCIPLVIERIGYKSQSGVYRHGGIATSAPDSDRKPIVFQAFVSRTLDMIFIPKVQAAEEDELAPLSLSHLCKYNILFTLVVLVSLRDRL